MCKEINIKLNLKCKKTAKSFVQKLSFFFWESPYLWELEEELKEELSTGEIITVPKGYQTDLSSVPPFLWGIFPPFGLFLRAALVHDFIYSEDYKRNEMGDQANKKFADEQMLFLSNKYNPNGKIDNYIRFYAVKFGGKKVYQKRKQPSI